MNDKTHEKLQEFIDGLFETPDDTLEDLRDLRKQINGLIKIVKEKRDEHFFRI